MSKAFDKEKHGYNRAAVDAYVAQSNAALEQLRDSIIQLKKEACEKDAELLAFKQKQELIVKSIISAAEKAEQIEQLIKQKFVSEMEHLSAFHQQWMEYYKKLIETYPLSSELAGLGAFNRRMSEILTGDDQPEQKFAKAREQFEDESGRLKKKYIGFIPVGSDTDPDSYKDLPDFDPEESIRQVLRRQLAEEGGDPVHAGGKSSAKSSAKDTKSAKPSKGAKDIKSVKPAKGAKPAKKGAANHAPLGESDTGFNFEEALNPKQALSDILKEIGLGLDDL